jgi:predicted nucleotidyltransferase
VSLGVDVDLTKIAEFCIRWNILEFAFFGSVLRDDFRADSDLDVLVTFAPSSKWTLLDHVDMQDELKDMFGRDVDLVSRHGIERSANYIRRRAILESAQVLYAA